MTQRLSPSGSARLSRAWIATLAALLALLVGACGAPVDEKPPPGEATSSSGSGGAGGSLGVGPTSSGAGASTTSVGTGGGAGGPVGLEELGSLVVLGDSIGDGGGQGPYYYDLLRDSLEAEYGPIEYRNRAESGSKTSALVGQISGLPSALPGPVAVAITSGGNDMKDNLIQILAGLDGPARTQMGNNVDAALDALLTPDRFGSGVAVHVFFATIYDASDGAGNYQSGGCVIDMNSPSSTDPFFESWNDEIGARVGGQGQTVADMHAHFYGHGFNNPPSWYASDCTHPNTTGHAELQDLFFGLITGM
jgi:hypothetical protein